MSTRDTLTFVVVTALLIVVAVAASLIPAMRATHIDPLAVIRDE